jgi:hypothetical protein
MTETVYLVRLRDGFNRSDYSSTSAASHWMPNVRIFGSRDAAERFVASHAPQHSPFDSQAVALRSQIKNSGTFTVDAMPDETHWEYYIGQDGTLGDLSQPPEEEYEDAVIPGRTIAEPTLLSAIQGAGLSVPDLSSVGTRTVSLWRDWWNDAVSTMTEAQRAAVWQVFTESPYVIIKLDAEV